MHRNILCRTIALALGVFLGACSSADNTSATNTGDPGGADACQGFPVAGIKYSPGGSVLPNTCKPFDVVTNNPYAIRCVDANPAYTTGYDGDDHCILPPPPEKGAQVGFHPNQDGYWDRTWAGDVSAYSDPAAVQDFLIAPGGERVQNYHTAFTNTEAHHYYRIDLRMRPGSHHFTSFRSAGPDGWDQTNSADSLAGLTGELFYNAIRPFSDRPSTVLEIPEEEKGLGASVDANMGITLQVHHINTSGNAILRELWVNVWWVPESELTNVVTMADYFAPSNIPAGAIVDTAGSFAPTADTRILSLAGHRHAWTTHFNAWVVRANGDNEEVYDSFDWKEPPQYGYDSQTKNPAADPANRVDGASTGPLTLHVGDVLKFNCHVENTVEQAMRAGAPSTVLQNLSFGNQAFGAEMCILNGEVVGAPIAP